MNHLIKPVPEIIGHEILSPLRFDDSTQHMIILDILVTAGYIPAYKGERLRLYLSDEGYAKILRLHERNEVKVVRHAIVRKGKITFDTPEPNEHQ